MLELQTTAFEVTASGLVVQGEPSREQWREFGARLGHVVRVSMWAVGDWLRYGGAKWGEMYDEAQRVTGLDYGTLRNAKLVSERFDLSRRRDKLPFSAHAEVAALSPARADEILDAAERDGLSKREVRALVKQERNAAELGAPVASDETCSTGDLQRLVSRGLKFGTVYADPPWAYSNQATRASTSNHYDTLTIQQLCELPVRELSADSAHLWLWTTNAFLFECPKLFDAWGYEFKSSYVWCKPQMGIGNYLRNSHEFLLLAVRGGLTAAARDVMSWGEYDRTKHSAKPEQIRELVVERISPGPRLELFGRKTVPGWAVWGNQIARTMFDGEVTEL